ncbi:hypothetical protein A2V61_01770 [Candidatus Woesebacteria bacterium RBG_19FT_COMBO_47_8]|uniref:Uncharacterized protein n=1 Tax=Candidatus Woesebacteria bacterium RBG_13_46_13 TaxID=1802479 RepID=A0A1F7X5J2_9BACT|nr:MAG: hypothetical protein A2Y68_01855 [Candidatus Woesebacteria bacterium RBG_13_46_13]OGM17109.1 MAG: hypothetical protein A2V61_01770 [Candidatus Woesebacteria bacterium RBG_19FT_COMBO_47_8]HJX59327.1 hypothetical protein [Patescibacteria group bacterium]
MNEGCNAITNGVVQLRYLECVFGNVVNIALAFAGIILFIMLISGGFKYITAGGDPKGIEGAKKTLTYAIGGIVLIALSFLILQFIKQFTGANVTDFKIFQ